MVLLNGNKYACETCIKGHRSSTCRHTDRPLFEIKKKGRPITQCEHCRELRKTKQVHVKCVCEGKEDLLPKETPGIKKGHTLIPGSAAFPEGLPEAMGSSVALPAASRSSGSASASDTGGTSQKNCCCKSDEACGCWWPRKHAPRRKSKKSDATPPGPSPPRGASEPAAEDGAPTASHILARLAELRPVLPRPTNAVRSSTELAHDPSSGLAHGHIRHHGHDAAFSPYGRAYDYAREPIVVGEPGGNQLSLPQDRFSISQPQQPFDIPSDASTISSEEYTLREQLRALEEAAIHPETRQDAPPINTGFFQQNSDRSTFIPPFPSSCNCGDSCLCPGCFQHNAKNAASIPLSSAYSSCMNPGQCTSCLDCTILALPASLPSDTSISIYDAYGSESIDDWIRQISQLPGSSAQIQPDVTSMSSTPSPVSDDGQTKQTPRLTAAVADPSAPQPISHNASDLEGFLRDSRLASFPDATGVGAYEVRPCCGVLCKCEPEECHCEIDKEGGYDCRREMLFPSDQLDAGNNYEDAPSGMLVDPYSSVLRSYSDGQINSHSGSGGHGHERLDVLDRTGSSSPSPATRSPNETRMVTNTSLFDHRDHVMGNASQGHNQSSNPRGSVAHQSQAVTSLSTPNLPAMMDTRMDFTIHNANDMNARARGSSVSVQSSGSLFSPPASRSVSPPSASSSSVQLQMTSFNTIPGELGGAPGVTYSMSMASDSDGDGYASDRFAGETGFW